MPLELPEAIMKKKSFCPCAQPEKPLALGENDDGVSSMDTALAGTVAIRPPPVCPTAWLGLDASKKRKYADLTPFDPSPATVRRIAVIVAPPSGARTR